MLRPTSKTSSHIIIIIALGNIGSSSASLSARSRLQAQNAWFRYVSIFSSNQFAERVKPRLVFGLVSVFLPRKNNRRDHTSTHMHSNITQPKIVSYQNNTARYNMYETKTTSEHNRMTLEGNYFACANVERWIHIFCDYTHENNSDHTHINTDLVYTNNLWFG